jgi:hypothetical protein
VGVRVEVGIGEGLGEVGDKNMNRHLPKKIIVLPYQ